ncbi:hypothetical protein C7212DRAFT_364008 [Tuber magnatum]|uniref:Inner centromere protein ARK-binding domain-containing protein n=1 Tax=Tuber magnatum TaxID=42249 RepID=A0A317SN01_9PEZI|nr:hypothetical protein C7212DRAFT_364008 [Tuber magnatum]
MVCFWLMDFLLWMAEILGSVASYIQRKRLLNGRARRDNGASLPTLEDKDPLPHHEHMESDQKDLASTPATPFEKLEKFPAPVKAPTQTPSSKNPIHPADPSHKPVRLDTDVPKGSNAPTIRIGSANWADRVRGKGNSAGKNICTVAKTREIEKLKNRFNSGKSQRDWENVEGAIAVFCGPGAIFNAPAEGAVPTANPTGPVSEVSSAQSVGSLNEGKEKYTSVSEEGCEPDITFGGQSSVGQKQGQIKKLGPGNSFAATDVNKGKKIQPYFSSEEPEKDLVDCGSSLTVRDTARVSLEAPKLGGAPQAGSCGAQVVFEAPILEDIASAGAASGLDAAGVVSEAPSISPAKLEGPLKGQRPDVYKGGSELPSRFDKQRLADQEQDQEKEPGSGNPFETVTTWKTKEPKSRFVELAESECKEESVDGGSALAILGTASTVSGAPGLETILPASSINFYVVCEVPELTILPPASSTGVQAYQAPKLENIPLALLNAEISDPPPIRQAKLENPLKKWRLGSRSYSPALKVGGQRRGRKRDQGKKPAGGKTNDVTSIEGLEEAQPYFTGEEPEENLVDGGSVLAVLDTAGVTLEALQHESTPLAGSSSVRVVSKAPIVKDVVPVGATSTFDAAGGVTEASSIGPTKLEDPLEEQHPSVYKGGYELPGELDEQRRGDPRQGQEKERESGNISVKTTAAWKTEEPKSCSASELAESGSGVGLVGGGSVPAIIDPANVISEASKLKRAPSTGSASVRVASRDPKPEVMPPAIPAIIISKAPTIKCRRQIPNVSDAGYDPITRLAVPEWAEPRLDSTQEPARGKVLAVTEIEETEKEQLMLTNKNSKAELADDKSAPTVPSVAGVTSEAPKPKSETPANSTSVQIISEAPKLQTEGHTFPPVATSEAPPTRPAKLENPLKKQRPRTRGCDLSQKLGGRGQGGRKREQTKKSLGGTTNDTTSVGKVEEVRPHFTSEEPKENRADGGNALAALNTAGVVPGALGLERKLSAGSASVQTLSEAPELEDISPASAISNHNTVGVVSEDPKLETQAPTSSHIAASEAPSIRPAKLENPLKKRRPSARSCDLSQKLGGQKQGGRKRDQGQKPMNERTHDTTSARKAKEVQPHFAGEEPAENLADGESAPTVPDTAAVTPEAPNLEITPPADSASVQAVSEAPTLEDVVSETPKLGTPTPASSPIAASETPSIRPVKSGNPLKKRRPRIRGYDPYPRVGGRGRDDRKYDRVGKPAIENAAAALAKEMDEVPSKLTDLVDNSEAAEVGSADGKGVLAIPIARGIVSEVPKHVISPHAGPTGVWAVSEASASEIALPTSSVAIVSESPSLQCHRLGPFIQGILGNFQSDVMMLYRDPDAMDVDEDFMNVDEYFMDVDGDAMDTGEYAMDTDEDIYVSELSADTQVLGEDEDVLMSDPDFEFDSITAEGAALAQEKSVHNPVCDAGVLAQRQHGGIESFVSQLERYAKSVMPRAQTTAPGGLDSRPGGVLSVTPEGTALAQQQHGGIESFASQVARYTELMMLRSQNTAPEGSGSGPESALSSDAGQLPEAEKQSFVAADAGALEKVVEEASPPMAYMSGEGLRAIESLGATARLGLHHGSNGGGGESEVRTEAAISNYTVPPELRTITSPSIKTGAEMESSSNMAASEPEALTSPSAVIDGPMQKEREPGLPEPTEPAVPFASSAVFKNQLKYKVGPNGRACASERAKKHEGPKHEGPKHEEPEHEEPKHEEPKLEEPKLEEPKLEEPKLEGPKLEGPKHEEPKCEELKHKEPKHQQPKHEESKHEGFKHKGSKYKGSKRRMGVSTEVELKWVTGPSPKSVTSGTLSSLVVPPEEPATYAWGATDVPLPPAIMDEDDDFTDIFGPIPIGTKPFVRPDSPQTSPKDVNPVSAAAAAPPAPGEKYVAMRPTGGDIHAEDQWAKNMPDRLNARGKSPVKRKLTPEGAEEQLWENGWAGGDTEKLGKILPSREKAASEKKAKDAAILASLNSMPEEEREEFTRAEEKRLNEQWDMEKRERKEKAARKRLLKKGIVRDIKPLKARKA